MPKKKKYINFFTRLEKEDLDWIRDLAFRKKVPVAEMIRRLVKIGMKVNGKKYAN